MRIGSFMAGLYQDQPDVLDQTPPPTAPDGVIIPEYQPIRGEVAGNPSTFVAHGVGFDTIGNYPTTYQGPDQSSQIFNNDLFGLGADIANPARSADGYGMQGPGTPELAINAPRQGAILDSRVIIHLGVGPGIPVALLAIIAGFLYLTRGRGRAAA